MVDDDDNDNVFGPKAMHGTDDYSASFAPASRGIVSQNYNVSVATGEVDESDEGVRGSHIKRPSSSNIRATKRSGGFSQGEKSKRSTVPGTNGPYSNLPHKVTNSFSKRASE